MQMFGRIALIIAISACLLGSSLGQTCSQQVGPAGPDATFNALFTRGGPGWTGGDSTYSQRLPDGRTVFFFSDSYVASTPAPNGAEVDPVTRTRANILFQAHNSLVVLSNDGTVSTIAGGDPQNPSSLFVPANSNNMFWMGDSTVIQTATGDYKLIVYLLEFTSGWAFQGTSVATLSLPTLSIDSITPLPQAGRIEWGSSVLQSGGHVFIYGIEDVFTKYPHVARTTTAGLTNKTAWQFWNGSVWVSDEASSARIIGAPDSISNEFNVSQIHAAGGEGYVLTTMDTTPMYTAWKDIVMYFSCSPQGPWTPKQVVYSIPESGKPDYGGAGQFLVYNPHSHFEFTGNGSVLVSYDLNTSQSADLVWADNYRPRFVRIPINGLR